jgi:hypothetical protein
MITKFLNFINENVSCLYPTTVYHGTKKEHNFNNYIFNGTFFSTDKLFANDYSDNGILYEVNIKSKLNLFDTKNLNDCKILFDIFKTLDNDIRDIMISPEELYNSDNNWYELEYTDGVMEWLMENYDGAILFEAGVKNIWLFNPIKEKIISYKEINI